MAEESAIMALEVESLEEIEAEVIDIFVRAAQLIGLPKSIGEIYGLLYISPEPLSMDQIMEKLRISLGTASQGLKQLRAFRAVKPVYMPGRRKDFFMAETEFRKLMAGFFKEEVSPHLESTTERLESIRPLLEEISKEQSAHYESRLHKLENWHRMGGGLIDKITSFIKF